MNDFFSSIKNSMANKWLIFFVTLSCTSLIFLNLSSVSIAVPTIQKELGFSDETVDWVINSYFLALTVLILPMGRLTDLFGLRLLYCLGFGLSIGGASLVALAPDTVWLMIGRIIQGFGTAALFPPLSSQLVSTFPSGDRGKAVGLNTGMGAIFLILGPLLGGFFSQYWTWRALFWTHVPIALFGFCLALFVIPKSQKVKNVPFDFLGACLLALSMGAFTVALMQGGKWEWTSLPILSIFISGILFLLLFLMHYRRFSHPLVDLSFFRNHFFSVPTLSACFTQLVTMVTVFWALYFQEELLFSPTKAALMILMVNAPSIFVAPFGGHMADIFGVRTPVIFGFSLLVGALIWFVFLSTSNVFLLFPALFAFGCGSSLILSPTLVASLDKIPEERRSSASGLSLALRQLSPTFGMAIMSAVYFSTLHYGQSHVMAFKMINVFSAFFALMGMMIAALFLASPKRQSV